MVTQLDDLMDVEAFKSHNERIEGDALIEAADLRLKEVARANKLKININNLFK